MGRVMVEAVLAQDFKAIKADMAIKAVRATRVVIVGVLGTGVPRPAFLRPMAWLSRQAVRPIFTNKAPKILARVQASRGGRRKTSSGMA